VDRADRDPELKGAGELPAPLANAVVIARSGLEPDDDRDLVELIDLGDIALGVAGVDPVHGELGASRNRDRGRVRRQHARVVTVDAEVELRRKARVELRRVE
jgi:hypothetical protein